MSFTSSLAAGDSFTPNYVVLLNGVYYAKHEPDSGVPSPTPIYCLDTLTESPATVNIKDAKAVFAKAGRAIVSIPQEQTWHR